MPLSNKSCMSWIPSLATTSFTFTGPQGSSAQHVLWHAAAIPDLKLQATARICLDFIAVPSAPASSHRSSVSKSPRRLWPSARSPRALHHGKHS
eukprot:CAMPEP_0204232130 /NCGR_PEP_ID=MMETSP0361-20130328/89203_1 /ASSEMBLY_ACC=CAM_ASM_000343 /TAXON_ID=268821 /ORGANISM="Scrippsiella Hangoei, Strain SHTV-5" /LENGTH=93 /DNA_ID=CAMNT_0051201891 /DNA_START=1 /DNA_END=279 /DNA_ORIENTATION=+